MRFLFFLFPIFLQAQCLIPTDSYRLVCADEVRYADSIASGSRLYISSKNTFVTSPRSIFNLVNGYGQYFIQITNSANSQKVAINRAWVNRIDSTGAGKALIYIKDINVTFTTIESYSAIKDSAISCFQRAVASGLATLSDGDYGDVVVSGGGLVMTVDRPDLGLHNLADGDFSVVADSTALSLTNTRQITLQTKNIDRWIARLLMTNNSVTLRTNSSGKNARIFVDTTGANFQFVNGANNASLRIGDSVAVRFNTSGSVGQVLTVTSVDGDGRLVINPKTGGSGTANCEQTLTKTSHGFRKWTPIYWNGTAWARPTYDSIIPTYIVVDSTTANTFKVANCGNYSTTLTAGLYYYKGASPGYSLTPTSIPTPLFEVAQSRLILQPLIGFNLAGGEVTTQELADTAAAIRADFPTTFYAGDGTISGDRTATLARDKYLVIGEGSDVTAYGYGGLKILNPTGGDKEVHLGASPNTAGGYRTFLKVTPTNALFQTRDGSDNWEAGIRIGSGFSYIGYFPTPSINTSRSFYASGTVTHFAASNDLQKLATVASISDPLVSNNHFSGPAYRDASSPTYGFSAMIGRVNNYSLNSMPLFGNSSIVWAVKTSTTTPSYYDWISVDLDNVSPGSGQNRVGLYNRSYYLANATPSTSSGVKQTMVWTGTGSASTVAFENVSSSGSTHERVFLENSTATSVDLDAGTTVKDVDGTNTTFTFPTNLADLHVYKNGMLIAQTGSLTTRDYSCNTGTNTITFTVALISTDRVIIEK